MTRWVSRPALACAAVLTFAACGSQEKAAEVPAEPAASAPAAAAAPDAGAIPAAAHAEAEGIFTSRCVTCHGPQGAGDGPASAGLDPKPRNFQDPAWQQSVSDEHIETIIQYGGAAVGRSAAMPGNPDLTSKPQVVTALREHVRSLGK